MAVTVFCPMEIERKAVERALRKASLRDVRVVQTGIGKDAVVRALAAAAAGARAGDLFVLAGACGGLAVSEDVPGIAAVTSEHGGRWTPRFADLKGVTLIAVDRIVATPADKQRLAAETGAKIVDMETHAFAAECERRGLAWTVVRGVSDTPEETLPAEVIGWVKPDGGTRAVRAAMDLARKPSLVPHIIGVVRRANRVLPKVGVRVAEVARDWNALRGQRSSETSTKQIAIAPLPVPEGTPLVILFGGTFDPPHVAHIELPRRVRTALEARHDCSGAAWLVYVPAAKSPHKAVGPIASEADRQEMIEVAIRGSDRVAVWADEIERAKLNNDASYTVDSLSRARAWLDTHGSRDAQLRLLIGADQAAAFHRWREPRRIIELAEPVVMVRGQVGADSASVVETMRAAGFWSEAELGQWAKRVVPVGRIDVSASAIREAIAAGRLAEAAEHLPAGVAVLIQAKGIYGAGVKR